MYTINFYQYQFQSKENIKPVIEQIITLATLSGYQIQHLNFNNPFIMKVIFFFLIRQKQKIIIKFFIECSSSTLKTIHLRKINPQQSIYQKEETNNNFNQLLTSILSLF